MGDAIDFLKSKAEGLHALEKIQCGWVSGYWHRLSLLCKLLQGIVGVNKASEQN
jgi:hypothetical protein